MGKSRDSEKTLLKVTLLLTSTMSILGEAGLSPALPAIRKQFGDLASVEYLTRFVVTLPAFFIAANAPIAGYFIDRFGRMKVLVVSLILLGLAGSSGYFTQTLTMVLVGRALVGVAVAGIMVSASTLVADYYTEEARARFMGLQTGFMGIGATLLFMIVGVLADISWRTPFLIHLSSLVMVPFSLVFLFEPEHEERCQEDPPPIGEPGTCAGEAIHRMASSSATALHKKVVPTRLIAFIYGLILFVEIIFFIIPLQLPFYLQELVGATGTQSGVAISFLSLSFALSSIFLGKPISRRDHISVLMLSFIIVGTGYILVSLLGATVALYLGLILAGVGSGILIPNLYVWVANETPVAVRGRVLGGFTTALFIGQFLSPIISQPIIGFTNLGTTILIGGAVLVLLVPFVFAGRGRLKMITAPQI